MTRDRVRLSLSEWRAEYIDTTAVARARASAESRAEQRAKLTAVSPARPRLAQSG